MGKPKQEAERVKQTARIPAELHARTEALLEALPRAEGGCFNDALVAGLELWVDKMEKRKARAR